MPLIAMNNLRELKEARREFSRLLDHRDTPESEWQKLFSVYPFILSSALPLKMSPRDIYPLARPGKSDPEFVFYPNTLFDFPNYGVIELKRPKDKIISVPRKDIITLSRNADTAIKQAEFYLKHLTNRLIINSKALVLGSTSYIFVIMGLSNELQKKIATEILNESFRSAVPAGCQIIPYDILFRCFDERIPTNKIIVLYPYFSDPEEINIEERKFLESIVLENSELLVDGVNSENVATRMHRPGGGFSEDSIPGVKGDRCIYYLENYLWQSDSAPAGITTKMVLDFVVFSKQDLLKAISAGFESARLEISGDRLWDYGIWEDAIPDFDKNVAQNVSLKLNVNLSDKIISIDYDKSLRPKKWTASQIKSLPDY